MGIPDDAISTPSTTRTLPVFSPVPPVQEIPRPELVAVKRSLEGCTWLKCSQDGGWFSLESGGWKEHVEVYHRKE